MADQTKVSVVDTESAEFSPEELAAMEQTRLQEITALEAKYGMSSEEFLRRWRAGEMPDNFETNYWAYALL